MIEPIRHRIKAHRKVRAGELVPHELNYRLHPELQKAALESLYQQIGFARSLLAYELPDGRLKLIDGHLRRDLDPDMLVEVEVLDVTEEEARVLLLSIDPLAALAENQKQLQSRLLELAPPVSPEVEAAWLAAAQAALAAEPKSVGTLPGPALFLILVTCRDEKQQVELLSRFDKEGLECKALLT